MALETGFHDRAAGSIVGAFIGDALALGPHWYYDLDELKRDFGAWIDDYRDPMPDAEYHRGMKAGQLSQSGLIMLMLLRSLVDRGRYDNDDFASRLDNELFPFLNGEPKFGPGGFTNHSIRQAWRARVKEGKSWGSAGGNADTSEGAERGALVAAWHANDPYAAAKGAYDCCRLTQTDSLVLQQSVGLACVIAALIRGEKFDEHLSDKLMALVSSGEIAFTAETSIAASHSISPGFGFASPDALLGPSWIARASRDPAIQIEPPWKVSLVYGMSCAIQYVLPCAYYLAARFGDDFESAVLHAVNGGGQNMSRACLSGALAGAQCGLKNIPRRFISGLDDGDEIVMLAEKVIPSTRTA